jgi:hypothetical protein
MTFILETAEIQASQLWSVSDCYEIATEASVMTKITNVQKRANGVYYLRIYIPSALVNRFGHRELIRSLATKRKSEAERAAVIIKSGFYRVILMAKKNPTLSSDELTDISNRYFEWALGEAKREQAEARLAPRRKEANLNSLSEAIDILNGLLNTGKSTSYPKFVKQLMANEELELDQDSPEYKQLAEIAVNAQSEIFRMKYDWVASDGNSQLFDPTSPEASKSAIATGGDETLGAVIRKFLHEHREAWKTKTYVKYRANLKTCVEIIGTDMPIRGIDKASVRRVKEHLDQLCKTQSNNGPQKRLRIAVVAE